MAYTMIYVVLGMYKSGTTLVSEMLHASGIDMGENILESLEYDGGNKYERISTAELNHALLSGCFWFARERIVDLPIRSVGEETEKYSRRFYPSLSIVRKIPLTLSSKDRDRMEAIVHDCNARCSDWGFKDPRSCLTYPLWREVLPEHKIIVVVRSYRQLLQRYNATKNLRLRLFAMFRNFRVLHTWTTYNMLILRYLHQYDTPYIVLHYESMMDDIAELNALSKFVDRTIVDTRRPSQYRNRCKDAAPVNFLLNFLLPFIPENPDRVYAQLLELRQKL
jgi:hypothetical protein